MIFIFYMIPQLRESWQIGCVVVTSQCLWRRQTWRHHNAAQLNASEKLPFRWSNTPMYVVIFGIPLSTSTGDWDDTTASVCIIENKSYQCGFTSYVCSMPFLESTYPISFSCMQWLNCIGHITHENIWNRDDKIMTRGTPETCKLNDWPMLGSFG